jgi:Phage integrase family
MSAELTRTLQRLLVERKAETLKRGWAEVPPWVFISDAGTPLDLSNMTKAWRRVLKKAELPTFRLYDLRHTFATTLPANGAPITYVATHLGHAKPTTTLLHYTHWIPRGDKRYVDGLDTPAHRQPEPGVVAKEVPGSRTVAISRNVELTRSATGRNDWSRRSDLNRRPVDYESTALPTELRRRRVNLRGFPRACQPRPPD